MLCIYIHIVSCKDLEQIYWMSAGKKSMGKALIGAGRGQHTVLVFCTFCVPERSTVQSISYPYFPLFYQKGRMLCHADSLYLGGEYLCYTSPVQCVWCWCSILSASCDEADQEYRGLLSCLLPLLPIMRGEMFCTKLVYSLCSSSYLESLDLNSTFTSLGTLNKN